MLNNRNIIAAIIVAISVFTFFALVLPEYDEIMVARGILNERRDTLLERTALVDQVASLNNQYDKNASDISKLDVLLPTNKQQDQIVSSMQDIAGQSGLILSEIAIADVPSQQLDTPYKSAVVTFRAFGQYEQFYSFVKLLERNLRLYDIQAMNISESQGSGIAGKQLNFDVKININSIR